MWFLLTSPLYKIGKPAHSREVLLPTDIVGRGTLDDKGTLIGLLEAVEKLLEESYQPTRTIYLASGHDEEVGGSKGAAAIAAHLKAKGVQAAMTLDEGGFISRKHGSGS